MTESAGQISSGINALLDQYQTVANNIANAQTAGYKRRVTTFSAELDRLMRSAEEQTPLVGQVSSASTVDFAQGSLLHTGRPLDIALQGKGFLALETPTGPLYTRNGSLEINLLGQLVDGAGRIVAGMSGPIVVPQNVGLSQISIAPDGTVKGADAELGKLKIVEFDGSEAALIPANYSSFKAPQDVIPSPAKNTSVRQGFQEGSNVRMMEEMVSLMSLSRLYEMNMNMIKRQRENSSAMLSVASG